MSQQQLDKEDNNGQLQLPLAKRNLEGDMCPVVLNRQLSDDNREQQSKHKENSNDGSLNWFDSIVSGNSETEKGIYSGSLQSLGLKMPSSQHCLKEKNSLRETKQAKLGKLLARVDPEGPSGQTVLQRQRAEKPTGSFSGAHKKGPEASCPTLSDSVITERASKKWHRENIKSVHGFCTSTPDPKARSPLASLSPRPEIPPQLPTRDLHVSSSHNELLMHGKLKNSARKRSRDQTKEGDMAGSSSELEILANSGPTAAKLTKFSFKQKPRLVHSVESNDHTEFPETICVPHSGTSNVSKGERTREECAEKNQLEQNNNVGNNSKEKQPCDNKEKQQNKVFSSSVTDKTRVGEEALSSLNPKNACSDTLAKLAQFSFVPRPESKPGSSASINITSNDEEKQGQPLKAQTESAGRRRCFELGKASVITGKSLFSITDFDDSMLDLDWDEEVQKKAKL